MGRNIQGFKVKVSALPHLPLYYQIKVAACAACVYPIHTTQVYAIHVCTIAHVRDMQTSYVPYGMRVCLH